DQAPADVPLALSPGSRGGASKLPLRRRFSGSWGLRGTWAAAGAASAASRNVSRAARVQAPMPDDDDLMTRTAWDPAESLRDSEGPPGGVASSLTNEKAKLRADGPSVQGETRSS